MLLQWLKPFGSCVSLWHNFLLFQRVQQRFFSFSQRVPLLLLLESHGRRWLRYFYVVSFLQEGLRQLWVIQRSTEEKIKLKWNYVDSKRDYSAYCLFGSRWSTLFQLHSFIFWTFGYWNFFHYYQRRECKKNSKTQFQSSSRWWFGNKKKDIQIWSPTSHWRLRTETRTKASISLYFWT